MKKTLTLSGDFTRSRVLNDLFDEMEAARLRLGQIAKTDEIEEYYSALAEFKAARDAWEKHRDSK